MNSMGGVQHSSKPRRRVGERKCLVMSIRLRVQLRAAGAGRCRRVFGSLSCLSATTWLTTVRICRTVAAIRVIKLGAADTCLWQDQFNSLGRLPITGQRRCHRTNLFIACQEQKGRSTAIALHSDDEDPFIRVSQLDGAMWANSAATMLIRINQRSKMNGALGRRIQRQTQLGKQLQFRSKPVATTTSSTTGSS